MKVQQVTHRREKTRAARVWRSVGVVALLASGLWPHTGARASTASGQDIQGSLMVDGIQRTYLLHIPAGYSTTHSWPLILAYHGHGGTGKGMAAMTHLSAVADREGFLVAYPDGLHRSWADGRGATQSDQQGVDDVAFSLALLEMLESRYAVNRGAVAATGISNGGFMVERLACDDPDRFVAIAPVAAALTTELAPVCQPSRPIAILVIQGTADPLVPYGGGQITGYRGVVLSSDASLRLWVALDGCTGAPALRALVNRASDGTSVTTTTYAHCADGATVMRYTIVGGGHAWPGGTQYLPAFMVGKASHNLDASMAVWRFTQAHTGR